MAIAAAPLSFSSQLPRATANSRFKNAPAPAAWRSGVLFFCGRISPRYTQHFTPIYAIRSAGLGKTKVDVGRERVQRQPPLQAIPSARFHCRSAGPIADL